jgi:hypothetical protein
MWFHQHFNTAKEPLKMLAFKPFGQKFRISDYERLFMSTAGGGHLIELEDENPKVREMFKEELEKEDIPSATGSYEDRGKFMRVRRLCLLIASLLFVLPQHASAIDKIVLGYSGVGSGEEVHHFAKEVGLFKKYGLDVEIVYIPGGSTVVQSMIAGDVQFGRGSATEVVTAHLAGFPLKILTALINKFVYSFVTPMSIAPQDLKGAGRLPSAALAPALTSSPAWL